MSEELNEKALKDLSVDMNKSMRILNRLYNDALTIFDSIHDDNDLKEVYKKDVELALQAMINADAYFKEKIAELI